MKVIFSKVLSFNLLFFIILNLIFLAYIFHVFPIKKYDIFRQKFLNLK
jgi:hypothetical protein